MSDQFLQAKIYQNFRIPHILQKQVASFLQYNKAGDEHSSWSEEPGEGLLKSACIRFKRKNAFPTIGRKCIFAAVFQLLGDF